MTGDLAVAGCGTYAGLQAHKKRREEPCQPCKDAGAAYVRAYRSASPARRAADRWWTRTRHAALERLAREYPERFQAILAEERTVTPNPWRPA
jgi:hypothetical protein